MCGFPSGGTDLLRSVLNSHPDIYINGEMPLLKGLANYGYSCEDNFTDLEDILVFKTLLKKLDVWNNITNIDHDFSEMLMQNGSLSLEEVLRVCFTRNNLKIWGNKTPQNTENIEKLAYLFPQAKFLVITRDVRDICLSWRNKWGKDMFLCADKWAKRMNAGLEMSQKLNPDQSLWIRYETLLSDLGFVSRQICTFLNVEYSDRMNNYHLYVDTVIDGKINYGQPMIKENTAKWKTELPPRKVRKIEEIAYPTMILLDYPPTLAISHKTLSPILVRKGNIIDLWSMLMVGNRASQNNTFLSRLSNFVLELKKRSTR